MNVCSISDFIASKKFYSSIGKICSRGCQLLFILCVFFLAGCASQSWRLSQQQWASAHWSDETALNWQIWQAIGKVAIDTPQLKQSANIDWQQSAQDYQIHLSGPLGLASTRIIAQHEHYFLQNANTSLSAQSAEQLMQKALGWWMPVSAAQYWLRGIAQPTFEHQVQRDDRNFPIIIYQQGWQVKYLSWQPTQGLLLPRKILLQHGLIKITLVITEWKIEK